MTYASSTITPIVFNSIPYAELNTDYLAVFGNYTSIRSTLEAQSNILDMLYNDNHSKVEGLVWGGFSANSLMGLAEEMSGYSFNQNALNLDLTMAASIINANTAGYGTSNFITDMYSHLSTTHYTNIMRAKYGVVGDFDEFLTLSEQNLYSSNRFGAIQTSLHVHEMDYSGSLSGTTGSGTVTQSFVNSTTIISSTSFCRTLGEKHYELTNHLSNVLVVITDKKNPGHTTSGYVDYYVAELIHQQDYYPFGSPMPDRKYDISGATMYHFGFNDKQEDNETYGEGDEYDYGMRMYDPRVGRFISVDPLTAKFAWWTPYQFAGDMPTKFIDLDGGEPENNNTVPSIPQMAAATEVTNILKGSEYNNLIINRLNCNESILGTEVYEGGGYQTDTKGDPNNQFNMIVNKDLVFKVDESNANNVNNYEALVVNNLMRAFVSGEGPENYDFPVNGIISSQFLYSDILNKALSQYASGGGNVFQQQFDFSGSDLLGTGISIAGFVGSGTITITPDDNGLQIKYLMLQA